MPALSEDCRRVVPGCAEAQSSRELAPISEDILVSCILYEYLLLYSIAAGALVENKRAYYPIFLLQAAFLDVDLLAPLDFGIDLASIVGLNEAVDNNKHGQDGKFP